jgi:transposase InsO family protein
MNSRFRGYFGILLAAVIGLPMVSHATSICPTDSLGNVLSLAELIHRRAPWKTKESVELATLEWVSWFNHHRLLEPLGYSPPAEAEANYYGQHNRQAAVAA